VRLALILAWHLLSFTLPSYDASQNCGIGPYPIGDQFQYLSVEASHDSLSWTEVARWGLRHCLAGSEFTIVAWPDTVKPVWYRVACVDTSENQACPSKAVKLP
jgi:hypothetical protein